MSRGFSPLAFAGFELVFRPWMRRRLAGIHLAGLPRDLPPDRPLLLVANHTSWWDGFLLWEIRRLLRPAAPMQTVMLESGLRRAAFLRRIGAFGIDPATPASVARGARELRRRVEERPDSMVFYFPQGRIFPSWRRPLGFRRGVELFARQLDGATVLPVGIHLEAGTAPAPRAWVSVGAPIPAAEAPSATRLEAAVEAELDAVHALLAAHGEDAPERWPGAWEPLPRAAASAAPAPTAGWAP